MFKIYKHYNINEDNSKIIECLNESFQNLKLSQLKKERGKNKSLYVSKVIEGVINETKLQANIYPEKKFLETIGDTIDIQIDFTHTSVIIEIDNLRADQVAKKVLSRTAAFSNKSIIYVSLCYDSKSAKGHKDECLKYINIHFKNYFEYFSKIEYLAYIPKKY